MRADTCAHKFLYAYIKFITGNVHSAEIPRDARTLKSLRIVLKSHFRVNHCIGIARKYILYQAAALPSIAHAAR
jgi:hypothetical protein